MIRDERGEKEKRKRRVNFFTSIFNEKTLKWLLLLTE